MYILLIYISIFFGVYCEEEETKTLYKSKLSYTNKVNKELGHDASWECQMDRNHNRDGCG